MKDLSDWMLAYTNTQKLCPDSYCGECLVKDLFSTSDWMLAYTNTQKFCPDSYCGECLVKDLFSYSLVFHPTLNCTRLYRKLNSQIRVLQKGSSMKAGNTCL